MRETPFSIKVDRDHMRLCLAMPSDRFVALQWHAAKCDSEVTGT